MLISSQLTSKHAGPNKQHFQYHLAAALQRRNAAIPHSKHTYQYPCHADDKDIYPAFCYKMHSGRIPAPFLIIMGGLGSGGLLITFSTKQ